jgi:hypothetical protein
MWMVLVCFSLSSCGSRESPRPVSSAADSVLKAADSVSIHVEAAADSTAGMTRSTPAWLGEAAPLPKLSREEIIALAPAQIRLQDLGFTVPGTPPDTTGLKNKAKVRREWADALADFAGGHMEMAREHLANAREFAPLVKDPDPLWPFRFRNLDAAALYSTASPGETKRIYGEIAEPEREDVFDVGYLWVMAMDDLRLGNGKDAVVRLRFLSRSPLKVSMEARKVLSLLAPEAVGDSSDA